MAERRRVAFVTIGQSPRDDLVPEMLDSIRRDAPAVEPVEVGALDDLGPDDVARLAPGREDHHLVSRLRDGREVLLGKRGTEARLRALLADLDRGGFALLVLLCTGRFDGPPTRTLLVEAQRVVDHALDAVAAEGRSIGLLLPLRQQGDEFHVRPAPGRPVVTAHASPYAGGGLEEAARALRHTDLIVMHCMGYTEAMRRRVVEVTGRPTLLARRLVAGAVAQLL